MKNSSLIILVDEFVVKHHFKEKKHVLLEENKQIF